MNKMKLLNHKPGCTVAWVAVVRLNLDRFQAKQDKVLHADILETYRVDMLGLDAERVAKQEKVVGTYQFLCDEFMVVKAMRIDMESPKLHKWVAVNNCKHYTGYRKDVASGETQ